VTEARAGVRVVTIASDDEGIRLDRWFARHFPETGHAAVSRWARTGQLRVDGARVKPEDRLRAGQRLRLPPAVKQGSPRRRAELDAKDRELAQAMVLLETKFALVLNKPPGLATQGGTGTTRHVDRLLDAFVAQEDAPRPRLVHRLDKDTSGALLIARTPGSAAFFGKRFAGRGARKVYWALVAGVPDIAEGTIDAPLAKQPGTGGEKMHIDEEAGKPARTRYRLVERAGTRAAWLELEPLTGRTHQLRVHCAAIGHPIIGDGKYGGPSAFLTGSISRKMHLHARRLVIDAPDGEKIDVTAPLPEHFAASMDQLGFDEGLSEAGPLREPPAERSPAGKKQAARRHAKQKRKERRGERRSRVTSAPAAARKAKAKGRGGTHAGRGRGKPPTGGKRR
jgi:23S rRNA pseudouridine955/2504/2580 synthase